MQLIKRNGKKLVIGRLEIRTFRDRLERLGKKRLGSRRRSVLASDKEESSSANSSRVPSPVRDRPAESPRRGKLSTPNLRPVSPNRSMPGSPASIRSSSRLSTSREQIRSPSRGAVQAAKE